MFGRITGFKPPVLVHKPAVKLPVSSFEFEKLFRTYSKNEIITTFQALLEMLKHQFIMVEQEQSFGTITIKLNPDWDLKDLTDEQFDEYN